ncbi:MAG: hypothetical protein CMK28_01390 [Porticoccaceae bacterium]|nr:hypothetical protein [Porticoccaceae bacterium]
MSSPITKIKPLTNFFRNLNRFRKAQKLIPKHFISLVQTIDMLVENIYYGAIHASNGQEALGFLRLSLLPPALRLSQLGAIIIKLYG